MRNCSSAEFWDKRFSFPKARKYCDSENGMLVMKSDTRKPKVFSVSGHHKGQVNSATDLSWSRPYRKRRERVMPWWSAKRIVWGYIHDIFIIAFGGINVGVNREKHQCGFCSCELGVLTKHSDCSFTSPAAKLLRTEERSASSNVSLSFPRHSFEKKCWLCDFCRGVLSSFLATPKDFIFRALHLSRPVKSIDMKPARG